jgi:hypothetical protein
MASICTAPSGALRNPLAVLLCLFISVGVVLGLPGEAAAAPCDQFDTGSPRWQRCIQNEATGGGQNGVRNGRDTKNDVACSDFSVGSREWTECVEDAATGGGLMPWIVVVPLGVMVLGMAFMFARGFMRPKTQGYSGAAVGSSASSWLIFMGVIELASGIGALIADQRASGPRGGYFTAGVALVGTAVILILIGIVLRIAARKKRRIEQTGTPGEARIVSVGQTGMLINNNPVIEFDLEVTLPGMAPYRTTTRSTVPMIALPRVMPGAQLPIKADPSEPSKIVVDWSRLASTPAPVAGHPATTAGLGE